MGQEQTDVLSCTATYKWGSELRPPDAASRAQGPHLHSSL